MIYRVAGSTLLKENLHQVKYDWCLEDVFEAHAFLNAVEQMAKVPKTKAEGA